MISVFSVLVNNELNILSALCNNSHVKWQIVIKQFIHSIKLFFTWPAYANPQRLPAVFAADSTTFPSKISFALCFCCVYVYTWCYHWQIRVVITCFKLIESVLFHAMKFAWWRIWLQSASWVELTDWRFEWHSYDLFCVLDNLDRSIVPWDCCSLLLSECFYACLMEPFVIA